MYILKNLWILLDDLIYEKICYRKIEENNINIEVEEKLGMLYVKYNGRSFMLKKYSDLNIILRSIIKGNKY